MIAEQLIAEQLTAEQLYEVTLTFYILFLSGMAIGLCLGLNAKNEVLEEAIKKLSQYEGKTTQEIWENLMNKRKETK